MLAFMVLKMQACLQRVCAKPPQEAVRAPKHHTHRGVTGLEKLVLPGEYEEEGEMPEVPSSKAVSPGGWEDGSDAGTGPGFRRGADDDEDGDEVEAGGGGKCVEGEGQAYLSRWDQWDQKKTPDRQYGNVGNVGNDL